MARKTDVDSDDDIWEYSTQRQRKAKTSESCQGLSRSSVKSLKSPIIATNRHGKGSTSKGKGKGKSSVRARVTPSRTSQTPSDKSNNSQTSKNKGNIWKKGETKFTQLGTSTEATVDLAPDPQTQSGKKRNLSSTAVENQTPMKRVCLGVSSASKDDLNEGDINRVDSHSKLPRNAESTTRMTNGNNGRERVTAAHMTTPTKTAHKQSQGHCPFCQMPFRCLAIESPRWHTTECMDVPLKSTTECPMGMRCDSTLQSHYRKYTHSLLANHRAGNGQPAARQEANQVGSSPNRNVHIRRLDFDGQPTAENQSTVSTKKSPYFQKRAGLSPSFRANTSKKHLEFTAQKTDLTLHPPEQFVASQPIADDDVVSDEDIFDNNLKQRSDEASPLPPSNEKSTPDTEVKQEDVPGMQMWTKDLSDMISDAIVEDEISNIDTHTVVDDDVNLPEITDTHTVIDDDVNLPEITDTHTVIDDDVNLPEITDTHTVVDDDVNLPEITDTHTVIDDDVNLPEITDTHTVVDDDVKLAEITDTHSVVDNDVNLPEITDTHTVVDDDVNLPEITDAHRISIISDGEEDEEIFTALQEPLVIEPEDDPSYTDISILPQSSVAPIFRQKSNITSAPAKIGTKQTSISNFFSLKSAKLTPRDAGNAPAPHSASLTVPPPVGGKRWPLLRARTSNAGPLVPKPSTSGTTAGVKRPSRYSGKKQCPFYKKMPGTPFTVDAFCYGSVAGCKAYILTHFHYDHYGGLTRKFQHPIYCSKITGNLVQSKLKVDSRYINTIPLNTPRIVEGVELTLMEANHCPGSVLILFKLPGGQVYLHTGDFRACEEMERYPALQSINIDQLYLDTTYCDPAYSFPPQKEVIRFAVAKAEEFLHEFPNAMIAVGSYTIGKERIFMAIAEALNCRVCVSREKKSVLDCLENAGLDKRLTLTPREARVHVLPMRQLNHESLSKYLAGVKPRFDRVLAFEPTGWTHARGTRQTTLDKLRPKWKRDAITVYGVPYSEHSSYTEMKRFCQVMRPRSILATVNNGDPQSRAKMDKLFTSWMKEQLDSPSKQLRQTALNSWFR